MQKKPYCLMPFIHLHIGNKGIAKACCVANIPFGNINNQSLEEIWNDEPINKLRDQFLKGEGDKRCAVCQNIEDTGGKSIRMETFENFSDFKNQEETKLPVYFDIRFSNVCNFRCRTCWHGASSKWFNDAKALGTNIGKKAILTNINDFENFIEKTGDALLKAEEFYFAGGEPLVTEEHYKLLEWLIAHKATKARLRYNTNFSKLSFKKYNALEMWKHFPKVEILASLDASETLGEYIRKDMKWSDILSNRKKIESLPHVQFKIAPTISVFNVNHLPQLYQQCLDLGMIQAEDLYINILERPTYYNIQILPKEKKNKIAANYLSSFSKETPIAIKKSFQEILDYMFAKEESKLWPRFLEETKKIDKLRMETFDLNF